MKNTVGCSICDKKNLYNYGLLTTQSTGSVLQNNQKYKIYLCEACFFNTLSHLKSEKRVKHMFDENFNFIDLENLGLK
ncbi:hypothetical protein MWMV2_MWMV2_00050 [Acinetobacter oleivorans]|nr:hypothetical protein MWMV12_MWMV12_00050 [Acinetobacter oleivorans]CAI3100117.1 hypothetical protein MWMV3_MWMV3_00050 [Acinetobacter oleivorans]CAI3100119.1 hypothetical protein MWMV19_MWMV19_00050 [Acinetobacter oleivorans]CAI3100146.1 hypothetical protein MWMV2_MWMV2_00050 [Acinetobacter oleivorans]CAI3118400.1 hypothetical protein MWMV5_MWMV5_01076 [Acinetobacter oleivorans]